MHVSMKEYKAGSFPFRSRPAVSIPLFAGFLMGVSMAFISCRKEVDDMSDAIESIRSAPLYGSSMWITSQGGGGWRVPAAGKGKGRVYNRFLVQCGITVRKAMLHGGQRTGFFSYRQVEMPYGQENAARGAKNQEISRFSKLYVNGLPHLKSAQVLYLKRENTDARNGERAARQSGRRAEDVREHYEHQLEELSKAYGEAMLELRTRKSGPPCRTGTRDDAHDPAGFERRWGRRYQGIVFSRHRIEPALSPPDPGGGKAGGAAHPHTEEGKVRPSRPVQKPDSRPVPDRRLCCVLQSKQALSGLRIKTPDGIYATLTT